MSKVLLVSMPYGALERPALGISLLKAGLKRSGNACDIVYLAHTFAECVGCELYSWLAEELPYIAFAGEWTFAEALYGPRPEVDEAYLRSVLVDGWLLNDDAVNRIRRVRSCVPQFLDHCVNSVPWADYDIVGFTSTFEQNIPSLAMAQLIKRRLPEITVVFGGANWEGPMGLELHRKFQFVDVVCSGESDHSFPAFVRRRLSDKQWHNTVLDIPGLVVRRGSESVSTGRTPLTSDMNDLPIPDFDDYFTSLELTSLGCDVVPKLLVETSRGCWWGAKAHCTFCGLNGGAMTFRSKSADRALQEIQFLSQRWSIDLIEVVDNILDMRYFSDFLPALAKEPEKLQLFYEIKANLKKDQVALLSAAGVRRVQPGIESLNDDVLRLMRKGTTALQNIQLLRWCREYGVHVDWNLLYGFPGEKQSYYDDMLSHLSAIRFLDPPGACGPVRLDRFSPYFDQAREFGIVNVRPMAAYEYLYPFEPGSLMQIAYFFDFDYSPEQDPGTCWQDVVAFAENWRQFPDPGTLASFTNPDGSLEIVDSRNTIGGRSVRLDPAQRSLYQYCDRVRGLNAIRNRAAELQPETNVTREDIESFLQSLVDCQFMLRDGDRYLALAIPAGEAHSECAAVA